MTNNTRYVLSSWYHISFTIVAIIIVVVVGVGVVIIIVISSSTVTYPSRSAAHTLAVVATDAAHPLRTNP
eukprot:19233-Prorocentrum_minimum.AAC.1